MFIYSNHYLIISKLTREDYTDFLSVKKFKKDKLLHPNTFSEIDETDYYFQDFIDLTIYYNENIDFLTMSKDYNLEKAWVRKVCRQEYDHIDDYQGVNKIGKIINDQMYYSDASEYFAGPHWVKGGIYYIDEKADEEEKEKQKLQIVQDHNLIMSFKDESVKYFLFPKEKTNLYILNENLDFIKNNSTFIADNVMDGKYILEELDEFQKVFGRYTNTDNAVLEVWRDDEEAKDGEINHICSINMCVDDDSPEYWQEPLFIFPLIREIDCFRPILKVPAKNLFDRFCTSPATNEWHETSEFDVRSARNTIS